MATHATNERKRERWECVSQDAGVCSCCAINITHPMLLAVLQEEAKEAASLYLEPGIMVARAVD